MQLKKLKISYSIFYNNYHYCMFTARGEIFCAFSSNYDSVSLRRDLCPLRRGREEKRTIPVQCNLNFRLAYRSAADRSRFAGNRFPTIGQLVLHRPNMKVRTVHINKMLTPLRASEKSSIIYS